MSCLVYCKSRPASIQSCWLPPAYPLLNAPAFYYHLPSTEYGARLRRPTAATPGILTLSQPAHLARLESGPLEILSACYTSLAPRSGRPQELDFGTLNLRHTHLLPHAHLDTQGSNRRSIASPLPQKNNTRRSCRSPTVCLRLPDSVATYINLEPFQRRCSVCAIRVVSA